MIDRIDKRILEILQDDSSTSNQDIADQVALSPSPCSRRIKQLVDEGYIKRHVALLSPKALGLTLTIFVLVGVDNHSAQTMDAFANAIEVIPEVIECHVITGQSADYLLKVMVPDLSEYETFLLKKLTSIAGVSSLHSSFVLRSITNKTALPLGHL